MHKLETNFPSLPQSPDVELVEPDVELVKKEEEEVMQAEVSLAQDPGEDVRLIRDDGGSQRQTGCVHLGDLPLAVHGSIKIYNVAYKI